MIHPESAGRSSITFLESLHATDEQTLKVIYTSNYPAVEQYITHNKGTSEDARDIYQEAFIAVWRNVRLQRFNPADKREYAAYLFQVAKNKWIDHLRAGKHKQWVSLAGDDQLPADESQELDETNTYIDAVSKHYLNLGERCRDLLKFFYFQKQSLRQIASYFSWTEETARNNKYRCLKQLRESVIQKKQ